MAQLAKCPACRMEIVIPGDMEGTDAQAQRLECPECEGVFSVADTKPHVVKEAKRVPMPAETSGAEVDLSDDRGQAAARPAAPKFGSATLSSFFGDDDRINETHTELHSPALAEFQSLEDLIRRGPTDPASQQPPAATVDDAAEDATRSSDEARDEYDEGEEPLPARDRIRPTLSELYHREQESADDTDDADSYDPVEDVDDKADATEPEQPARSLDEFPNPSSFDRTARDSDDLSDIEVAASVPDAPTFDFKVGDAEPFETPSSEGPRSLRAAMGFAGDEPLEVEEPVERPDFATVHPRDEEDIAPELSISGSDTPRGVVATRKRSSALSAVRTVVGVAGGGVVGIVAGYLLLLWIFHFLGRSDEPLALAKYYPNVVKPPAFQDNAPATAEPGGQLLAGDEARMDRPPEPMDEGALDGAGDVEVANFEADALPGDAPEPWSFDAQPAPPPLIQGAPSYTAAELQQLTAVGLEAVPGITADGPIDKQKGGSYAKLAKLAEALTFGEGAADVSWKDNARQVFAQVFANPPSRQPISTIAEYWLVSDKRGHGGIFFSGTPDDGRQQGTVAEYTVTLSSDQRQQLTVLTPQALPIDVISSPEVVVVGAVVDDPASRIEGYTGTAKQAVWSSNVFPVNP